ncbi:IS3 family transposase [Brevibacillus laterosporus]|nr:IS3 family transposase [Brevibacillus laterosporus]TPG79499.1 IS3 family transposase [Brevibacillus laterosporus]TPG82047.1 IS3 family transposase [Brevibacillus laterosporus]TPG85957.1 IS3 family transposase [Brevibacillus laterosporus]TPG88588.1 IS3 family transposase [Brevibacillus laterosporus]TPG89109.1 IS3 family transposase [Brevibacillus laterosporus]
MPPKKGQVFTRYSEEIKKEAVRLRVEDQWSFAMIRKKLGIKSDAQIIAWVQKHQNGESFVDYRGRWNKKHFSSVEEENAYLRAQVEYPKKAQSESSWGGKLDKQARFRTIEKMSQTYSITTLCKIAEVSRAGFYKWKSALGYRQIQFELEANLKEHILAIHRLRPIFGYKRMRTALLKEGFLVNHKKVRRLMRELEIRSVIRKKRPFAGRKPSVVFPNVLNREFTAETILKKFVTDITYIRVGHDFVYLSVVLDLYNNEVVAWDMSSRNDLQLVLDTIKHLNAQGAILHSDQGFQYTTKSYKILLEEKQFIGSHSRRGNCFDNACVESFFSHLKTEKLYLEKPASQMEALKLITEYINFYNQERFQKKLGDLSPVEYREAIAA